MRQLIIILFISFLNFNVYASDFIRIKTDGGDSSSVKVLNLNNLKFISAKDFALSMRAGTYYNDKIQKFVIYLDGKQIKLTASNPFVLVNNEIFNFPVENFLQDNDIYLPIRYFIDILNDNFNRHFEYRPSDEMIFVYLKGINITGIEIEQKLNGTLLRIFTTKNFPEKSYTTRLIRDWLYVDIYGGKLDSARISSTPLKSIVKEIVPIQQTESVQISFRLSSPIASSEIHQEDGAFQVLLRFPSKTTETKQPSIEKKLEDEKEKWLINKIVVDAGHGGKDPGAIGPTGFKEKQATLDIALRLEKLLREKLKVETILTRKDDSFVELHERTRIANSSGGKLFVSIHCNSNPVKASGGFETYFLSPAKTEKALATMELENSAIHYEDQPGRYDELQDENFILRQMAQSQFVKESEELASLIQTEVGKKVTLKDRGVDQAGFYVLVGASMPNVLFETAFISNPYEEKLLKTNEFKQKLAEAIYESIKKFKQKRENEILGGN
jgi:N-acetylmuramoyl-L-alanine amidase